MMASEFFGSIDYAMIKKALREEVGRKAAESKGTVFNTSVTANADIFASALSPTYTPYIFRIHACFSAAGVLTVRREKDTTTVSEQLNGGTRAIQPHQEKASGEEAP